MLKDRPATPGSLPEVSWQNDVRIVLVDTQESLNAGSVARAMSNLSFSNLQLVNPRNWDLMTAGKTACWARPVLEAAGVHSSLEEATKGTQEVVALCGRATDNRHGNISLPEWVQQYHERGRPKLSLLFGSEDEGLSREQVAHARYVIRIPSNPKNPMFNLAQSVTITLWELSRPEFDNLVPAKSEKEVNWEEYPILDQIVEEVCTISGYYRDGTPHPTPTVVKQLLRRMRPNDHELRVMLGLFASVKRKLLKLDKQTEQDNSTKIDV